MRKLLTYFIFPLCIIGLAFLLYRSINEPVKFNRSVTSARKCASSA